MTEMFGLLYYGRLEREKGFDSILELIKDCHDVEFFIFGTGSLEAHLLPLTQQKNVHYFGRQPLDKIKCYLENIDYCLMPSEFLETFGLSALNALSRNVPVIGYKKGGLEPFILPECNLFAYKGKNTKERLLNCITKLKTSTSKVDHDKLQRIVQKYTEELRYQRFIQLFSASSVTRKSPPQKIVLVSDFINKMGGIETYLHDVKALLESKGHEVILRGGYLPKGIRGKVRIHLGLVLALVNFGAARKLERFLQKEKPDLIWFHSLLRNLGGNVVWAAKRENSHTPIWMMYHDFGYFYPYPRDLFSVDELKTPFTFQNFISSVSKKRGRISKIATVGKYFRMKGLMKIVKKKADLHLVPSPFMEDIVCQSHQIAAKKVKAFPHFVQK